MSSDQPKLGCRIVPIITKRSAVSRSYIHTHLLKCPILNLSHTPCLRMFLLSWCYSEVTSIDGLNVPMQTLSVSDLSGKKRLEKSFVTTVPLPNQSLFLCTTKAMLSYAAKHCCHGAPSVLSECLQLSSQNELAYCNQIICPYGVRSVPSGCSITSYQPIF